jgi:hypothetical protein
MNAIDVRAIWDLTTAKNIDEQCLKLAADLIAVSNDPSVGVLHHAAHVLIRGAFRKDDGGFAELSWPAIALVMRLLSGSRCGETRQAIRRSSVHAAACGVAACTAAGAT